MSAWVRVSSLIVALALAAIGYDRGEQNAWFVLAATTVWLAVVAVREIGRKRRRARYAPS
jgi:hypothetical protein